MFAHEILFEEPSIRNSNLLPVNANGEVLFLSVVSRGNFGRTSTPSLMACEIDRQGRIPLNEDLINHAGMTKDIVLVGVNSKFEIWDSEKWRKADSAFDTDMMLEGISEYEIRI